MFLIKSIKIQSTIPIIKNLLKPIYFQMQSDPVQKSNPETSEPLSKNALKKLEKDKLKAEKKAQHQQAKSQAQPQHEEIGEDVSKQNYGDYELIQSQSQTNRKWTPIQKINDTLIGQSILLRARLANVRAKRTIAFLVLREEFYTIQAVAAFGPTLSKQMIKFIEGVPKESIIDLEAEVVKPEQEILSCTQKVELKINKIFVVSRAEKELPFQIEDASRLVSKEERDEAEEYGSPLKKEAVKEKDNKTEEEKKNEVEDKKLVKVLMKTRLDNRVLDLRTQAKQAVFRLTSGVCQLFRQFLFINDFMEIHTPKLIGGTSEGGSNVFRLKYFEKEACLAQSPQLYKQMCVMADFQRVFEIGPVFRAENSFTHRHMCEFTGVDLEMTIKEHYFELMDFMGDMFVYIFENMEKKYSAELKAISLQYPFDPFVCRNPVVKLTFEEACKLLNENGIKQSPFEDFDTETEKKLGALVKTHYNTDFYMVYKYPISARPFYTMLCKEDPRFTNSYDFFIRGEEITSGSQRVHDPVILAKRAQESGIPLETIQPYINAFKLGAYPHGGCGIGLERVIMLYCALGNIRNCSLFPRDPKRIFP